ncbi:hypothetical protein ACIBEA_41515 [Streptomyces sp. NPDC051555]
MSADISVDRGGVCRHAIRCVCLRLDAAVDDVPGLGGTGPRPRG